MTDQKQPVANPGGQLQYIEGRAEPPNNDVERTILKAWVAGGRFVLDKLHGLNKLDPSQKFTGRLAFESVAAFRLVTGYTARACIG